MDNDKIVGDSTTIDERVYWLYKPTSTLLTTGEEMNIGKTLPKNEFYLENFFIKILKVYNVF